MLIAPLGPVRSSGAPSLLPVAAPSAGSTPVHDRGMGACATLDLRGRPEPEAPSSDVLPRIGRSLRRSFVGAQLATFKHILSNRLVDTYGAESGWPRAARKNALAALFRRLDFHSNGVTFRGELRELSARPEVAEYLVALEQRLRCAATGEPFALFALTEGYAGSPDEAMRWIAVLLQDVRLRTATDDYFEGEVPESLAPRFRRIMTLMQEPGVLQNVDLYPPGVELHDQAFYHYYVPAHLARRLRESGVHPELAGFAATVFNTEYELNQHVARHGVGNGLMRRVDFIRHGTNDGADMDASSIEQIRAGHSGAMRGAGLTADASAFTPRTLISPRDTLRRMMREAHERSRAE